MVCNEFLSFVSTHQLLKKASFEFVCSRQNKIESDLFNKTKTTKKNN